MALAAQVVRKVSWCVLFLFVIGIITQPEVTMLNDLPTPHGKWWVPFMWSFNIVRDAHKEGRIASDFGLKTLQDVSLFYYYNYLKGHGKLIFRSTSRYLETDPKSY